jgi:ribosomal protein S18 acetylase RimI-like enzyme
MGGAVVIESFLPGRVTIEAGVVGDYRGLERFHYVGRRPATWAGVWVVRYSEIGNRVTSVTPPRGRVVAVAVLSFPTVRSGAREAALGLVGWEAGQRLAFVNRHVRTISRVVVHPQFRGVGLASRLVRHVCAAAGVRYVEAFAVMGRVHPFFERGGMVRRGGEGVGYFLWEGGRET